MKARLIPSVAVCGVVLGLSLVSDRAAAQVNRAPDPNATRVMVPVFASTEKGLGVQAADAVRSRINSDFPFKQVYVLPKQDINAFLEGSGFSTTEPLAPHDAKALAQQLRADEYLTGTATKTADGFRVEVNLVLARDNALVQPVGAFDGKKLTDVATSASKELKEARKQLDAERKCVNFAREGKYDEAVAAAREGVVAYPKATLARICLANVLVQQKASADTLLKYSTEIVEIDPRSRPGLAIQAQAYRDLGNQDSAVVSLTRLLASDPTNPRLQKDVVEALAEVANPRVAKPVIDQAVELNPGDPDLLRLRWLILLATREYKEAFTQGDELVRLDTAFADTTYFIRTAAAYAADSQPQKAAEYASRGVAKFPGHPGLVNTQVLALRGAGQQQQALEALTSALAANVPVENGNFLRLTLLRDLGRTDEIIPAAREIIASGDTSSLVRQLVVGVGDDLRKKAGQSNSADDFQAALNTLAYADSITTGQSKMQAQFLLGVTYVSFGNLKVQQGQADKACQPSKDAQNMLVEAQIMLPKGGSFAPDAMRQAMQSAMQLSGYADQLVKAYCR